MDAIIDIVNDVQSILQAIAAGVFTIALMVCGMKIAHGTPWQQVVPIFAGGAIFAGATYIASLFV